MRSVRRSALNILAKIEDEKAYAAPLIAQEIPLFQPPDRRLLVELVYGTLRWRLALDHIIARISRPSISNIDTTLLNILRMGVYQFFYLDRIPSHAIVHTSVEMAKLLRGKKAAGFVNAILRGIGKMGKNPHELLPKAANPEALSIRTSHPRWLVIRWIKQFGYEKTAAICKANTFPSPATLRVNASKLSRKDLIIKAGKLTTFKNTRITPTKTALNGLTLSTLSALYTTDWFEKGLVDIQDEASQIVSEIADPLEGEHILDACSGMGGKSLHLLELSKGKCSLICCDAIPWKLKKLEVAVGRSDFDVPARVAADMRFPPFANADIFDKVLVDAPCSNTGVLRRHPERKWHLTETDIRRMPDLQTALLEAAANLVRKGGVLVYSTCSLEREEGEEVVEHFLKKHPTFQPGVFPKKFDPFIRGNIFRSFPHKNGMDGFFCARFIRRQS